MNAPNAKSFSPPTGATTRTRQASRFVVLAVNIVVVLSILDLALTLWRMHTTGMFETNRVAVALVKVSPWALIGFKVAMTFFASTILIAARQRPSGLIGGTLCVLIMLAMILQWVRVLSSDAPGAADHPEFEGAQWVCLADSCR